MIMRILYDRLFAGSSELTPEQRRAVEDRMNEHALRNASFLVLLAVMIIATPLACVYLGVYIADQLRGFGLTKLQAGLIGPPLVGLLCLLAFYFVAFRLYLKPMRRALRDIGLSVCEQCGYDLREIESEQCPECGAERS